MSSLFHKTIFTVFIVIFSLLLGEILIRIFNPYRKMLRVPVTGDFFVRSANPVLSFEYKKNYIMKGQDRYPEYRGFFTNSSGFRDYEFREAKPAGIVRIIILGDSVSVGETISDVKDIFPRKIEGLLNQDLIKRKYEVFNMAVVGYDTLKEVETLRVKGLRYKPDIVIIVFCINDFDQFADSGISWYLKWQSIENNTAPKDGSAKRGGIAYFISKSKFLFYLYQMSLRIIEKIKINPPGAGLALLNKLQEENGFTSYLFIVPAFDAKFNEYKYGDLHKRILQIASFYPRLHTIDLLHEFASINPDPGVFSIDPVHLSGYGHAVLAELVTKRIKQDLSH